MNILGVSSLSILGLVAIYFLSAAVFMWTWNYGIPRLAESVDTSYMRYQKFKSIDYTTALVVFVLIVTLSSPVMVGTLLTGIVNTMAQTVMGTSKWLNNNSTEPTTESKAGKRK
jgi:hypothetical protein